MDDHVQTDIAALLHRYWPIPRDVDHFAREEARAQWWREQLSDSQLTTLCAACGWQGGTFWQVVDEIRRLKAIEAKATGDTA